MSREIHVRFCESVGVRLPRATRQFYSPVKLAEQVSELGMEVKTKIDKGYVSLVQRTVETQMMAELMDDYGFPNAICRSLKEMFMGYFDTYIGHDKGEGQIVYRAIPEGVPPGIEVSKIKTLPVRLTIVDVLDIEIASKGMNELTKHRIVRITNEAFDQGGVLTQADVSIILGEGLRTINRRVADLKISLSPFALLKVVQLSVVILFLKK